MRSLPTKLKFAAYAYAALGLWVAWFLFASKQLALILPMLVLLAGSPVIGWGLRTVRRWSYIAAIVHAPTLVAIAALTVFYVNDHVSGVLIHAFALVVYFSRKDVRAPYLATDKRGFRSYKRFETNLRTMVETPTGKRWGETLDISAGGAYLHVDTSAFVVDARIVVEIQLRDNQRLRAPARVVSLNPDGLGTKPYGIGIQFTSLTVEERTQLQQFISLARRHERLSLALPVSFTHKGQNVVARTVDLSMSGCYLATDGSVLQPGDRITMSVSLHDGDVVEIGAEVMWLAFQETQGKPPGVALQFMHMDKLDRARLRDRLKESGGLA